MTAAPAISTGCLGWAHTAGYSHSIDEDAGVLTLRSEAGTRYFIRHRAGGRVELSEAAADEDPRPTLFTATATILERFLYAVLGDEIREDVSLPYLHLPCSASDIAPGYRLAGMDRGYRILNRIGHGPVAAAPDEHLSLVTLVPLSHLLGLTVAAAKRTYLSVDGAPLLVAGRYADAETS